MDEPKNTEAELESFRRRWQEEVSARSRHNQQPGSAAQAGTSRSPEGRRKHVPDLKPAASRLDHHAGSEELAPRAYHDLPDKEADLKLGAAEQGLVRGGSTSKAPHTALEHYEHAVDKETAGHLGDSLNLYRRAFKMDDKVHEKYKNKHFPPSAFASKPAHTNPSNASTAHDALHGLPPTIAQLLDNFSLLSIPGQDPPTELSPPPPCPISDLPEEILANVLHIVALHDIATFSTLAQVCKRFAYLVMTEEQAWKSVTLGSTFGFGSMHYDFICDLKGNPVDLDEEDGHLLGVDDDVDDEEVTSDIGSSPDISISSVTESLLKEQYASSWRYMFRHRPRLRFGGCYISTVNYPRPGGANTTTNTWNTPVHIVTYFRYLRFFRDGRAISLLTTTEPADVVHHLTIENLHKEHGNVLPQSVMRDALAGRWRLSGPGDGINSEEAEGDVHIETDGVIPKYMYKMQFALGSAGRGTRNNKLTWKGFWSYNKVSDDWGEFGLKHDKTYYWSRVKSYGLGG